MENRVQIYEPWSSPHAPTRKIEFDQISMENEEEEEFISSWNEKMFSHQIIGRSLIVSYTMRHVQAAAIL